MPSIRSRINILWLDDSLVQEAQWFSHLRKHVAQHHPNVRIIEVTRIERFAEELRNRSALTLQDDGYIDWIWLDVMLKPHSFRPMFDAMGFDEKPLEPMRAGAQVLDIMQNPFYFDEQPDWLRHYRGRCTTLLTCLLDIKSDWSAVVDLIVRQQVNKFSALVKHLKYGTNLVEPDQAFKEHVKDRLRVIEEELVLDSAERTGKLISKGV